MSVKRQAKGIKWPWLIISPKEYLCWQSTGKESYKREQNSLKHTNKSNLLKLICIRGCGPLSKNTNVDSSNPNKPYVVYQEKSFSAGNALAGSSRKIESEIWLLGQRTSNPSACLLMPQQLRHGLKAWESWETIFFCVHESSLAMWFHIPELHIFQWCFARPRSITCSLSAFSRVEREKDTPEGQAGGDVIKVFWWIILWDEAAASTHIESRN